MDLTTVRRIRCSPGEFLGSIGTIFKVFAAPGQDSGNVSWGVAAGGRRCFVKSTDPGARVLLGFDDRVALLRNAVAIAQSLRSPLLPELLNVVESPCGPLLVYEWVEGELLRGTGARNRFRQLPVERSVRALDGLFELHQRLAAAGRIAVDFYDGCLIYDFARDRLHGIDLDHYTPGPIINTMGRMFGSSRFMAPEEFELGRTIDERTMVYNMGRAAFVLLSDGTPGRTGFRAGDACYEVALRACAITPCHRYPDMVSLLGEWRRALSRSVG